MSRLPAYMIRHPQLTFLFVALMVAVGAQSVLTIPRSEDPSFPVATYSVVAVYPGATPKDVERLIVEPIEKNLTEIGDIKRMRSRAENGFSLTIVEFTSGVNVDSKKDAVIRQVEATRAELPAGITRLETEQFSTTNVAILQMALVSETTPFAQLEKIADALTKRLEILPGVKNAKSWGIPEQEVRVEIDPDRLSQLRLPVGQVLQAIQSGDTRIPGGTVTQGNRTFSVETQGGYRTLDDLRSLHVTSQNRSLLTLQDVATVETKDADPAHLTRWNGKRCVFVTVTARDKQNIFTVREAVAAELAAVGPSLPPAVTLELGFDQSVNVSHRLGGLTRDFFIAIALVLLTLLPLGFRASVIVMVAVPLSLALGLTMLQIAGYSINQLSIVGFVIALGLLVDDSIVVTENIIRNQRLGHAREEAAILGTSQIFVAVLGCTATLLFAFLPLLFLPGTAGDFIRSMPLAVVYTIAASLLVSVTVIPFLASRVLGSDGAHENFAYRFFNRTIEGFYRPVLVGALARPKTSLGIAAAVFLASFALVPSIGFSLFPKAGTPQFLIRVTAPEGTSFEKTDATVRFVEAELKRHPEVKVVLSNVGRGNPQIYYNVAPAPEATHLAEIVVELQKFDPHTTPAWIETLRETLASYPGARIEVKEFENGPPIDAPVAIRLLSADLDTLRSEAARIERLLTETPGTRDIENPLRVQRTDVEVVVDHGKAGLAAVPRGEIDRAVRLAIAGLKAGTLRSVEGDDLDVVVTLPRSGRPTLEQLERLFVTSSTGEQIPFSHLARLELHSSPSFIQHENKERAVTITAQVRAGFNTDRVTKDALARLNQLTLAVGARWVAAGEIESRKESFGGLGGAILIATFGILGVLLLEFKTWKSTLIVASVVPLGVVGGLVALWLAGYSLSFTAMVGFIALVGVEVKNSILLVDFTNQLRAEGVDMDSAIERAGKTRFFPVLLTSMTAIGGLVPLALEGSSLYSPLAIVIIGGLFSSTVLSRLVTPCVYKLIPPSLPKEAVETKLIRESALAT